MIRTFANQLTEEVFYGRAVSDLSAAIQQRALTKLQLIHAAADLRDLEAVPSNNLVVLSGDRDGRHCISIDDMGRICFRWEDKHAYDVEIFGYH